MVHELGTTTCEIDTGMFNPLSAAVSVGLAMANTSGVTSSVGPCSCLCCGRGDTSRARSFDGDAILLHLEFYPACRLRAKALAAGLTAQHVVDDDPTICQLLTRYFEGEGYIVSTAFDGQEMRRHLKQNEVDIVLLDVFRLSVLRS